MIEKRIARKLQTGRSQNDQVATGLRQWLRDQLREIEGCLVALLRVMISRAKSDIDNLMPGYRHMQ